MRARRHGPHLRRAGAADNSRWGPTRVGTYVNERAAQYNLLDAIFSTTDDDVVSLARIRDGRPLRSESCWSSSAHLCRGQREAANRLRAAGQPRSFAMMRATSSPVLVEDQTARPRRDMPTRSRGLMRPSFANENPLEVRGCREDRVSTDTRGPRASKSARGRNHRLSRIVRPSLRERFTAYTRSPRGPALLPPSLACSSKQTRT
jgi:hypothetical protein